MTRIALRLKNGFKYSGTLIEETETLIILQDIKLGRLEVLKTEIAVRGTFV